MTKKRALIGDGLSPELVNMKEILDEYGEEVAEAYLRTINNYLRDMSDEDYDKLIKNVRADQNKKNSGGN